MSNATAAKIEEIRKTVAAGKTYIPCLDVNVPGATKAAATRYLHESGEIAVVERFGLGDVAWGAAPPDALEAQVVNDLMSRGMAEETAREIYRNSF
jgi:hypothetical protein